MPTQITRPRLSLRLRDGLTQPVIVVCGLAGSGKTTAVRQWLSESPREYTWLALDARDDDPVRFWRRLGGALTDREWGPGTAAPNRDRLDELLGLATVGPGRIVVLDDLHTVRSTQVLDDVAYICERLTHTLVLLSRSRLPASFSRLRIAGRVHELTAAELAFTTAEVAELFAGDEALAAEVHSATEGWPVAVGLSVVLGERDGIDHDQASRELIGYLTHEVLGELPPRVSEFVRDLAVLDEASVDTVNAALGITDAAELLDSLEQHGLLLAPSEEGWTLHPVVRDALRDDLDRTVPERARRINLRAATHLAECDPERAIGYALAADDPEFASDILERGLDRMHAVAYRTQLRWLQAIPEPTIRSRPTLRAHATVVASYERRPDLVARWLRDHDEMKPDSPEALGTKAMGLVHSGDMPRLAQVAALLRARIDEGSDLWRFCHGALTGAMVALGDDEGALRVIFGILSSVARTPVQFLPLQSSARAVIVVLLVRLGRLEQARLALDELRAWAMTAATVEGFRDLGATAWAEAMLGLATGDTLAARNWREPPPAEASFGLPFLEVWLRLDFAVARLAVGDEEAARGSLHRAQQLVSRFRAPADLERRLSTVGEGLGVLPLPRSTPRTASVPEELSERELTVLRMLDSELSAREIAGRLFLSPNTLKTHLRSVYRKLSVNSRLSAVRAGRTLGLIHPAG